MTEENFIRQQTTLTTPSLVPEIKLQLATECTPLWQMTEERLKQDNLPPPFWAFAWPGGQGMTRYILENPDLVKGKRVLDFAGGRCLLPAGDEHFIAALALALFRKRHAYFYSRPRSRLCAA
jgi:predicted nicotinamide N-methyase